MFSHPWFLCLIPVAAAILTLRWIRPVRRRPAIPFPGYDFLPSLKSRGELLSNAGLLLPGAALCCLILIAAGIGDSQKREASPLPDALVIVLDVSSSMTADDFSPTTRLEEAKNRLKLFVASNRKLEIGLILFAASPRLAVPVTLDHSLLSASIQAAQPAGLDEDGTAIGSGLASAVNRLRVGSWGARRILLITDGVSNRGGLAPLDAARFARLFGIRIDIIGIGTDAVSRFWVPNAGGSQTEVEARIDIDDKSLAALAAETGGRYQRVRSSSQLGRSLAGLGVVSRPTVSQAAAGREERRTRILSLAVLCLLLVEIVFSDFIYSLLPE